VGRKDVAMFPDMDMVNLVIYSDLSSRYDSRVYIKNSIKNCELESSRKMASRL